MPTMIRRFAIPVVLLIAACGDNGDPTDPFQLAGARFALSAVAGGLLPAHAWDFLGDPVIIDEGSLEFTATRYLALVVRCIDACASVPDVGTWSLTGQELMLTSDLNADLVAAFDGATLTYDDHAGRAYLWERH